MATAKTTTQATTPPAPKTEAPADPKPEPREHAGIDAALAAFQRNLPAIAADNVADIKPGFQYKYANLADVALKVLPLLAAQGLSWSCQPTMTKAGFVLKYALTHGASGEKIKGRYPLSDPARTAPQTMGGAITYAKRYVLLAVAGVHPFEDDDDAAQAQAQGATAAPQRPAQPPRPVAAPQNPERLPEGLYDTASLHSTEDARAMYKAARRAGHLHLLVRLQNADGTFEPVPFGMYLQKMGERFDGPPAEDAEAPTETTEAADEGEHEQ